MKFYTAGKTVCILTMSGLLFSSAAAGEEKTENKNITFISAQASADGKSDVWKELLEECIESLPQSKDLQAEVSSETAFLKGINGDEKKNDHMKTYKAVIEINYMLYQKELMVVAVRSIQGQPPVMKEIERRIKQTRTFTSEPGDGNLFAGRSNRQYYFSSREAAEADVKQRAETWLRQQSAVVCSTK